MRAGQESSASNRRSGCHTGSSVRSPQEANCGFPVPRSLVPGVASKPGCGGAVGSSAWQRPADFSSAAPVPLPVWARRGLVQALDALTMEARLPRDQCQRRICVPMTVRQLSPGRGRVQRQEATPYPDRRHRMPLLIRFRADSRCQQRPRAGAPRSTFTRCPLASAQRRLFHATASPRQTTRG